MMAKKEQSTAQPRKFLFDTHNFDDHAVEEEEIIEEEPPPPPPPPTFSEEELAQAKEEAFAAGKREAEAAALASREQFVAGLLDKIAGNFTSLFAAEEARSAEYEAEAVHLAGIIFQKLFPGLNERLGLAEIERTIARVLEGHREQPRILIEVHPDYVEDIEKSTQKVIDGLHGAGACTVAGAADLGKGDCRLQWESGGAQRSATRLAQEIEKELAQVLADKPRLHDNEYSNVSTHDAVDDGVQPEPGEAP